MRQLKTDDVFSVCNLIVEADLFDDVIQFYEDTKGNKEGLSVEKVGMKFCGILIKKLNNKSTQKAIYEFLASLKGCTVDEYKKQPLVQTIKDLRDLYKENDITDFLQSAGLSATGEVKTL